MFGWLKRLVYGTSEAESESKISSTEQPVSGSSSKKARRKHAREDSRRQRARERQLSREFNGEDSKWVMKGSMGPGAVCYG
ncbi:hypothetical protein N7532_008559 [Penicillium argentinense]|uniref:Uncharacterized protein n=1 Tax=Penicillium argentinense TaxID=1131581 RepID=A0A9W9EXW5_9EURO|nr:uncharacterized protein N7532_008559 [Penicillium argentinense]KAJ5089875.1 hypothetical protein N7532_008559 [Penicillium argentinense]